MLLAPKLLKYILLRKGALLVSRIYNDATEVALCNKAEKQKFLYQLLVQDT
jgi:hypothetical protein